MTAFLRFLEEVGDDDFTNVKDLEGYLLDFAVHTYYEREGSGRQLVINAMLAVELYFPNLRGRFTDLRASLEGWAKQVPPMPRHVISELVAFGLAVEFLRKSRADMATAILTAFECYLRSGDMENAKCEDYIHLDVPQGLRGSYYGILSLPKTKRGQNESVYVRDPLVAELLRRQREIRSKRGKKPKIPYLSFVWQRYASR